MKLFGVRRIETHCNVRAKGQGSQMVTKSTASGRRYTLAPPWLTGVEWRRQTSLHAPAWDMVRDGATSVNLQLERQTQDKQNSRRTERKSSRSAGKKRCVCGGPCKPITGRRLGVVQGHLILL